MVLTATHPSSGTSCHLPPKGGRHWQYGKVGGLHQNLSPRPTSPGRGKMAKPKRGTRWHGASRDGEGSLPTAHCPASQLIYQFDILVCPHYRQREKRSLIYQSKRRTCFFCAIDISVAFPFFSPPCRPRPVCRLPPSGPKKPKFTNLLQLSLFFLDASQFSMQNVEVYMLHSFSAEVYSFQQ